MWFGFSSLLDDSRCRSWQSSMFCSALQFPPITSYIFFFFFFFFWVGTVSRQMSMFLTMIKFMVFLDVSIPIYPCAQSQSFLVTNFLVSKYLGFQVSWFQSFKKSKFQWSHITNTSCDVFWKILIPYSRCSRSGKTGRHVFLVSAFSNIVIFPKTTFWN